MFSWSASAAVRRISEGRAFSWFALSLSARRSGLLGEVLRKEGRVPLRFTENLGFGTGSTVPSTVYPRESAEGEDGAFWPVGEVFDARVV